MRYLLLLLVAGCSHAVATPDPSLTYEAPCNEQIETAVARALDAYRAGSPAAGDPAPAVPADGATVPVAGTVADPVKTEVASHDDHHHAELLRLESENIELRERLAEADCNCDPYKDAIDSLLNGYSGALVFGATWCGPCKTYHANLDEVATLDRLTGRAITHIDVDQCPELAERFGIKNLPTTVIVGSGIEARRAEGVLSARQFWQLFYKSTKPFPGDVSYSAPSGCPCGCNGQCGGQCGCPDCPCGYNKAAPQRSYATQPTTSGPLPNFTIDGTPVSRMSTAELAKHWREGHGRSDAGMDRAALLWAMKTDHDANGWGKYCGAHRGYRTPTSPQRVTVARRQTRSNCPNGRCPR